MKIYSTFKATKTAPRFVATTSYGFLVREFYIMGDFTLH